MKKLGKVLLMFILTLTMFFQYMPVSATSDGTDNGQETEEPVTPSEKTDTDSASVSVDESQITGSNAEAAEQAAQSDTSNTTDAVNTSVTDQTTEEKNENADTSSVSAGNTEQTEQQTATQEETAQNSVTNNASANTDEVVQNNTDSAETDAGDGLHAAVKMNINGLSDSNTATETAYVSGVKFSEKLDGTAPWDADENAGDDQNDHNDRIRSYDQIKYKVEIGYQSDTSVKGKNLFYEVTIKDDDQLQFDWKASGLASETDATITKNTNNHTKTYTYKLPITTLQAGAEKSGGISQNIVFNVLGMKNNETFQPTIRCWFENNDENIDNATGNPAIKENTASDAANVDTATVTTVTTAPAYNIILKPASTGNGMNVFNFNSDYSVNTFDKSEYTATDYQDQKVTGFGVTWGVAVEMRKEDASKGIRGIEEPDPNQDLKFDVELSGNYKPDGGSKNDTKTNWPPLLYRVMENDTNNAYHISAADLPGSNQGDKKDNSKYCYNSGSYTVTQDATDKDLLHFTIKNFQINRSAFPTKSLGGSMQYFNDEAKTLEGVFTSALFTVVYPMKNNNGNIQTTYGENGQYYFDATAKNINATSVDHTKVNSETVPWNIEDQKKQDNHIQMDATVKGGHGRSNEVFFSSVYSGTEGSDFKQEGTTMNNKGNASDSAVSGSHVYFSTDWTEKNSSIAYDVEGRTVAVDQLVLVEGNAIEISNAARNVHNTEATRYRGYYLYPMYVTASKPLTFKQTKELKMDSPDLSYYGTLEEAKSHGSVVGVLLRWRGISYSFDNNGNAENGNGTLLVNQTEADISKKQDDASKVYSITVQSNFYDTTALPDVHNSFTAQTTEEEKAEAYRTAAVNNLLSNGPLCKVMNVDNTPVYSPAQEVDNRSNYVAPTYDAGYKASENFSTGKADSLYVVPYYTQITKTIAQSDQNGNQKTTYDQSKGEKYADYKLTGSLNFENGGINYENGTVKTDVTIKDTIPSGLTYVEGSSVWNPSSYSEQQGKPGKITGGTPLTPEKGTDENGLVTLTWKIQNVEVKNGNLPSLYYTCLIDKSVTDSQSLKNTAEIWSTDEHRAICSANKNTSDAAINIIRSSAFNINKYGDHDLELNDEATFTLVASNSQNTARTNFLMVDSMPYDGKDTGAGKTVMKGKYDITSITVNNDSNIISDTSKIHIYYTYEQQYAGVNKIGNVPLNIVRTWTEANRTDNGDKDPSWNVTGWPTAIAIEDDSLGAYDTILATIHYKATADKDDHLYNFLMTEAGGSTINSKADTVIYDRDLSGTVWIDDDFDGVMDPEEERVPGVKVQLMQEQDDGTWKEVVSFKDLNGNTCPGEQITDSNGYYSFDKLPKGKYKVVFKSGNTDVSDLTNYYLTDKNAGPDSKVNSKTDAAEKTESGKLKEGNITDITMPTIEQMKADGISHYDLPDQNMGLYRVRRTISGTAWFDANGDGIYQKDVTDNTKEYPMAGVEVSLYHKDKDGKFVPYKVNDKEVKTTTDGEGHYVFEKLPEGEYEVIFSDGKGNDSKISEFNVTKPDQGTDPVTRSIAETGEKGTAVVSRQNGSTDGIDLLSDQNLINQKKSTQVIENLNAGFVPKPADITITKVWKDDDNKDALRPDPDTFRNAISLERFKKDQNGKASGDAEIVDAVPEVKDNQDNTYTVTYNGLLSVSYDGKTFTHYVYKVKEDGINGYSADVTEAGNGKTITNTYKPSEPVNPAEPQKPANPEIPAEPEKPGTPVQPTPTVTPEPTPSEVPDVTPVPSETPEATETPVPSATPETVVPGEKPAVTPSSSPSPKSKKQVKNSEAPDTGDHNNAAVYAGLLILCCVFIVWRVIGMRKEHHND